MNITEIQVMKFYKKNKILKPHQLSFIDISEKLDMQVEFWEHSSEVVRWRGKARMFLNESLNAQQTWQEFGHEVKHVFYDAGRQELLPESFVFFQETKADYFAYHFCVPTFMLDDLRQITINDITNLFNVEYNFAARRLDMYESKVIDSYLVAENREVYLS